MSKLDIGTKVFIIPNEMEKNGAVGVVDGFIKKFAWVNGKKIDSSLYSVNGNTYARADLAIVEDMLEFANADSGKSIYRTVEAIDTDHETVLFKNFEKPIKANEVYYCDICGEMHIFGIDDGSVVPNVDEENDEDNDEFNLGFMLGYLEAVEDANDYINSDVECLWDKALASVEGAGNLLHLFTYHRDKLTEFYNKVIELKNIEDADTEQTDVKPELTLDEIKEKLGYDFNLVD